VTFGDAVKRRQQRYFMQTPRFETGTTHKSLMQWATYGLPM